MRAQACFDGIADHVAVDGQQLLVVRDGNAQVALGKCVAAAPVALVVGMGVALVEALHRNRQNAMFRLEQEVIVRREDADGEAAKRGVGGDRLELVLEAQKVGFVAKQPLVCGPSRGYVVDTRSGWTRRSAHLRTIAAA